MLRAAKLDVFQQVNMLLHMHFDVCQDVRCLRAAVARKSSGCSFDVRNCNITNMPNHSSHRDAAGLWTMQDEVKPHGARQPNVESSSSQAILGSTLFLNKLVFGWPYPCMAGGELPCMEIGLPGVEVGESLCMEVGESLCMEVWELPGVEVGKLPCVEVGELRKLPCVEVGEARRELALMANECNKLNDTQTWCFVY